MMAICSIEAKIRQHNGTLTDKEPIPCLLSNGAARVGTSPPNATRKTVNQEEYCMLRSEISKGVTLIPAMIKLEGGWREDYGGLQETLFGFSMIIDVCLAGLESRQTRGREYVVR